MVRYTDGYCQACARCGSSASGKPSTCHLAEFYEYLAVHRQVYVHTRAEFDESQMVVYIGMVAFLRVCHYTPGHSACHLAHRDFLSVGSTYAYGASFVLCAGFGQVCRQEAPFVVAYVFHRPVGREPVGVHVEGLMNTLTCMAFPLIYSSS